MKRTYIAILVFIFSGVFYSCKDQLDIKNPNQPEFTAIETESGIISFAQGGVYVNGFKELKYYDGVPGYFWSGAIGFHELMGDVVGEEAANLYGNQIGAPEYVVLDNGSKVNNPNSPTKQIDLLRQANINANAGQNPIFYEWAYMYNLNNACNVVLDIVDKVTFSGDADTRRNTLKAWAYWWKGYAYSRIGSIYYAGLIVNEVNGKEIAGTNGNYVTKEQMIAEANSNFDQAAAILNTLNNNADYQAVLAKLIPDFNQVGKGGLLAPNMWKRNINTMKARNILVNTTVKNMTAARWNEILTLTNNGINPNDKVFTGRSNESGDFLASNSGTVAAKATGNPTGGATYKISERLIQDIKTEDRIMENNIDLLKDKSGNETI